MRERECVCVSVCVCVCGVCAWCVRARMRSGLIATNGKDVGDCGGRVEEPLGGLWWVVVGVTFSLWVIEEGFGIQGMSQLRNANVHSRN